MIFSPHILQARVITPEQRDGFGRPIVGSGDECWHNVCACRCDDNSTKHFTSQNGEVYRPKYHVVCERAVCSQLIAGAAVRILTADGTVRGEGEVYAVEGNNFLPYMEVWI